MNYLHGFSYFKGWRLKATLNLIYISTAIKEINPRLFNQIEQNLGRPRPLINLFLIITRHILSQSSVKHLWGKGNKRIRTSASKVTLGRDKNFQNKCPGFMQFGSVLGSSLRISSCNMEIILKRKEIPTHKLYTFWMAMIGSINERTRLVSRGSFPPPH